ncbi:MAG: polysaccharide export protein [Proteobacteria bacterium]|nr:polysaccharide export protein [Pseudomonadota bacterium]
MTTLALRWFGVSLLLIISTTINAQELHQPFQSGPTPASPSNYRINPNDLLDCRVFQETDLDCVVRVAGDGTAIFPLIGSVKIGGLSVAEATQQVASRLRNGYLVSPQVNLTVREYAKRYFTLLGEVGKPGAYDMSGQEGIPLLQAIGMGGGYSKIANPSNITVKRMIDGKETILRLNAKRMAKGADSASFMVHAGDIITVGEAMF